ncbi:MAG: sugar phosphate nucleotidyltransferase [Candidatus Roizmanbacteria bacterium]|nr:sugar phosphate nucleotidyltransferase [Candidatus Roizmanbacteria bacterium]
MDRERLTITLRGDLLKRLDGIIDGVQIRNRSHAIEYLLSQSLTPKISQAIILAGGQGVQMRPLTYEVPKPLIPVGGKPLIEHTIEMLREAGIRDIILAICHLGTKIKEEIGNGKKYGVSVTYSEETKALGSAGAVRNAASFLHQKPFIVVNGDILTKINLSEVILFHQEDKYDATMVLSTAPNTSGYGVALLRGERIVKFLKQDKMQTTQLINAGIYIMNPSIISMIKGNGDASLEDLFVELAEKGKLAGFTFDNPWFEVSTPENYERAIKEWKE